MKTFTLNDGTVMPTFGLGTWKSAKGKVKKAVAEALRIGYTHVDAAWIYQNEQEVGEGISEAIAQGSINRDSLFVTSKLWNTFHQPEAVEKGCKETLSALGLDYLDLYLMHWPIAFKPDGSGHNKPENFYSLDELSYSQTFEAMAALREKGLVKSVGVSNFTQSKIEKVIADTGLIPAMNQVELHPYNPQDELLAYCKSQGICVTAYSPLGSGDRPDSIKQKDEPPLLENDIVKTTAAKENISPAQLLIAWALARDTITIPKSTNAERIAENLAATTHTLSPEAKAALNSIDIRYRYVSPKSWFFPGITYKGDNFWA